MTNLITKIISIFIISFCFSASYQSAGIEMTSKAIVGKKIADLSKQYIICQDINNPDIYYSFFVVYKKQWFTNRSIIQEYKLYLIKVSNGKVIELQIAPENFITTDIINEIQATSDTPSVQKRGWLSFMKEDFAGFSPLG